MLFMLTHPTINYSYAKKRITKLAIVVAFLSHLDYRDYIICTILECIKSSNQIFPDFFLQYACIIVET